MSMDRSLRAANQLQRHRNVLTRAERLAILMDRGDFDPSKNGVLGLPKVAHRKIKAGGKRKAKAAAEEASAG